MAPLPVTNGKPLQLQGYVGASKAFELARHLLQKKEPLVIVVSDLKEALRWKMDLEFYLPPGIPVTLFPSLDVRPYYHLSPNPDVMMEQLGTLWRLSNLKGPFAVVLPVSAFMRRLPPQKTFLGHTATLEMGASTDRDEWVEKLVRNAYQRVPLVEDRGTYAVRGGILDFFSPAHDYPVRVEFFGDTVESIRFFNFETQKSIGDAPQAILTPAHFVLMEDLPKNWTGLLKKKCDDCEVPKGERDRVQESFSNRIHFNGIESYIPFVYPDAASILDYLPAETLLCFSDLQSLKLSHQNLLDELAEHRAKSTSVERVFAPEDIFLAPPKLDEFLPFFPVVDFVELAGPLKTVLAEMETNGFLEQKISASRHRENVLEPLIADLKAKQKDRTNLFIVAGSPAQRERLKDLMGRYDLALHIPETASEAQKAVDGSLKGEDAVSLVHLLLGPLSQGFYWPQEKQWWITDEEIFGQKVKKAPKKSSGEAFSSFSDLTPGDFIVHQDHGIGVYRELTTLTINNVTNDFLLLEYLGGDKLYVPVDQLDRISRFSAQEGVAPLLDKMGGASWIKVRERVKKATRRLARELLEMQAKRMAAEGYSFSPRNALFEEFEATFPFEETEDQAKAINDVLSDMESGRPMDRLVCGDVGYGKTEVAIRGAFKAVLDQKQVAVLVPTTVLAFQHYETFKKRFEKDAIQIALLSRFQTAAEQKKVVERLAKGEVDIIIATHRLLSQDIKFRDLGLLIIDEEHRFGVAQKERMKKLKSMVDVVTLTATPIPRTLNFALTGIRDLSIINTPPADRLSVRTYVTYFDEGAIREAILREIKRGGQVYFVHNRVQTIQSMKDRLMRMVPEATIRVGHGQMPEEELEGVMLDFMEGKFQILLCTTIIESGLDIPAANTILINHADAMGLAQLYQLRGRVGRSHHRAYCYLLIPQDKLVSAIAKKRLSVIERFTELGSGFKIASHDLEIRGAGNILGPEQSGQIAAVGYDLYIQLLEEAVNELKGLGTTEEIVPEMKLGIQASIPQAFIPDTQLRLLLYKQLTSTKDEAACADLRDEWMDRFGDLPQSVKNLIELICLKNLGRALKISSIAHQGSSFVYQIHPQSPVPTEYFLNRAKIETRKTKIMADGKFVITENAPSDEAILSFARKHLTDMKQAMR